MKQKKMNTLERVFVVFVIAVFAIIAVKQFLTIMNQEGTGGAQTGGIFSSFYFGCVKADSDIKCSWLGCPATGEVMIFLSDGSFYKDINKPMGEFTFGPMEAGSYSMVLTCGEKTATYGPITVG